MSKQLANALSEGFINGLSPKDIAKNLVELIEKGKMADISIKDKLGRTISTKNRSKFISTNRMYSSTCKWSSRRMYKDGL